MESLITHLLAHFLGRWSQERLAQSIHELRSLRRVIPRFDELWAKPHTYLHERTIVIGPPRRFSVQRVIIGCGLAAAASLAFLVFCCLVVSILGGDLIAARDTVFWWAVGVFVLITLVTVCWQRRGWCELSDEGVLFRHRGYEVHCSWALFRGTGSSYVSSDRSKLMLPICTDAVGSIMQKTNDAETAAGAGVRTPFLELESGQHLVLESIYDVVPEELGILLSHLGRSLGQSCEPASWDHEVSPEESTGWIALSLTRLVLPSWCCSCLAPAEHTEVMRLRDFHKREIPVSVPFCEGCHRTFCKQRLTMRMACGIAGLVCGVLLILVLAAALPDADTLQLLLLGLVLAGFGIGMGVIFSKDVGVGPVRLRLCDQKGLLYVRCANPQYARLIREQLRLDS
jgi:hypothetical protein